LQVAVQDLTERLSSDPAFGGGWYDHFPCYRIVLAFTDAHPRPRVIEMAAPELRPFIAFARSKYSEAEREQARREIGAALNAAGVRFALFYSTVNPEQFTVQVRTEADARTATAAIPIRYRSDTSIIVGETEPRRE
jgi:hypothetical protein